MNNSLLKILSTTLVLVLVFFSILADSRYIGVQGGAFWSTSLISGAVTSLFGVSTLINKRVRMHRNMLFFVPFFFFPIFQIPSNIFVYSISSIFSFTLLISMVGIFESKSLTPILLWRLISFPILFEVVVCYLQFFGIYEGHSSFFKVYGTLGNPNLSAMFLAISSPFLLYGIKKEKIQFKVSASLIYIGVFVALLMLNCRTAIVGFAVSGYIFMTFRFEKVLGIFAPKHIVSSLFKLLILVCISVVLFFGLYMHKKESADGRLLVWKLSFELGVEKPYFGHGLGSFERVYNLAQADYFSNNTMSNNEAFNADYIQIAYNDFLHYFVERGVFGLFVFLLFMYRLLFRYKQAKKSDEIALAYAGIFSFFVMALFNSVSIAVPVFLIFLIFVAIKMSANHTTITVVSSKYIGVFFIFLGVLILSYSINQSQAKRKLCIAYRLSTTSPQKALAILKPYRTKLKSDSYYWITLGNVFEKMGKHKMAIKSFSFATKYSSNPDIYRGISANLESLALYEKAIEATKITTNMIPSRLWPKMDLMRLYYKAGNIEKSRSVGFELMQMKQKGSIDIAPIKQSVKEFLKNI